MELRATSPVMESAATSAVMESRLHGSSLSDNYKLDWCHRHRWPTLASTAPNPKWTAGCRRPTCGAVWAQAVRAASSALSITVERSNAGAHRRWSASTWERMSSCASGLHRGRCLVATRNLRVTHRQRSLTRATFWRQDRVLVWGGQSMDIGNGLDSMKSWEEQSLAAQLPCMLSWSSPSIH